MKRLWSCWPSRSVRRGARARTPITRRGALRCRPRVRNTHDWRVPTPSERNALVFFAAVALLGAAVRFHRASADEQPPSPAARAALERQIAAVDDARELARSARTRRARRTRTARDSANAISSAPPSSHDARPSTLLDLDTAPAESLVRLPRIGPALAKRIVADRDSLGPFGSVEGFQRVRGVGPAMARALGPYVTFSGTPRPSPVGARVSTRRRASHRAARDARVPP
jgi:competence protein ComEA